MGEYGSAVGSTIGGMGSAIGGAFGGMGAWMGSLITGATQSASTVTPVVLVAGAALVLFAILFLRRAIR